MEFSYYCNFELLQSKIFETFKNKVYPLDKQKICSKLYLSHLSLLAIPPFHIGIYTITLNQIDFNLLF